MIRYTTQQLEQINIDELNKAIGREEGREETLALGMRKSVEYIFEFQPEITYEEIFAKLSDKYPDNKKMIEDVLSEFFK